MIAATVALSLLAVAEGASSYHGKSVLRCSPTTTSQLDALHEMDVANESLDFWKEPTRKGGFVDIMVGSEGRADLQHKMDSLKIPCEVMMDDVQAVIDEQKMQLRDKKAADASYFESYHPPAEVFAYIETLVSSHNNRIFHPFGPLFS